MNSGPQQQRQLRVFIVISSGIITTDALIREQIADLYTIVYKAPPWNELFWTQDKALEEIAEAMGKDGFADAVAMAGDNVVGFSWGYRLPIRNTARVDIERIRCELAERGINPDKAFYGADTGVTPSLRNAGIAGKLINARTVCMEECDNVLFRTKNPAMLRVYRRALGNEMFSFLEESAYSGGRVYVFGVK